MKQSLKALLPAPLLQIIQRARKRLSARRNASRSARDVFSEIYRKGHWGTRDGDYCSGGGSFEEAATQPYTTLIKQYLQSQESRKTIVDLGCGDLEVSRHFLDDVSAYIGVDVVPGLIEKHQSGNWGNHVKFISLDIVEDDLPDGDICFLRQVLQHLSNAQISKILPKLKMYNVCFVTEHYPTDNPAIVPNKDIVHGGGIRPYENSGVYLDESPFNVPRACMELILEVPGVGLPKEYDQGVIRTYRIDFNRR